MSSLSKRRAFWIAGVVCLTLGGMAFSGRAAEETAYDAATGATTTSSGPVPVTATLKAANGSRVKGSFTGVLTGRKGQFRGTVKLPLPHSGSGIVDAPTAQGADLVLELTRQGQLYTRCDLILTGVTKNSRAAKFALAAAKRNGNLQQQTGFCELTVAPFGSALPTPLAGDTLSLKAITANGDYVLAAGVFHR